MSSLAAGTTLCGGRYRLDSVIGRGGMAVVWRATDLQLERDVAIKIISDLLAGDERFVARFEREARLAAGLNHVNLVKVFDFSVDGERPFLIMEYVRGGTLAEARGRPLDLDSLAGELLDALAHIHAAGILHRDIKPANVLLDEDDSPRLTDFGIARGEESTGLTLTGQILGTLRYIAPEVAAGRPASPRSDLYSLGVLLGDLEGPPTTALSGLIERMSARDPEQRPASAAAALAELDPTRVLPGPDTEPTVALSAADGGREKPQTAKTTALDPENAIPERSGSRRPAPTTGGLPPFAGVRKGAGPHPLVRNFRAAWLVYAVLLVVVLVVVVAAASGGGSKLDARLPARLLQPAPAKAPVSRQIERLELLVQAAPRR